MRIGAWTMTREDILKLERDIDHLLNNKEIALFEIVEVCKRARELEMYELANNIDRITRQYVRFCRMCEEIRRDDM